MSDTLEQDVSVEPEQPGAGPAVTSLLLPAMLGALAWGASLFLPSGPFLGQTESLANWLWTGQTLLREVLRALAVLGLAISISTVFPRVGLGIERIVLRSDRRWFLIATALFALVSSAVVSRWVLGGVPHIQDEVAIVFQARVFAEGRLYADTPPLPEFFDHEYVLFDGPRWYGKYFSGSSVALVPGLWVGAVWLMNPLFGALAVLATFVLGRELLGEKVARVAALLMAVSPFRMSLCSMLMAHPVTLLAVTLAAVGVVKVVRDPRRWGWSLLAGVALGYAANTRPLTAAALGTAMALAAMPALPWRQLRWQTVAAFVLPIAIGAGAYFGYNKVLTGDARVSPFEKWCPKDRLGFGPDIGQEYWPDKDRGHSVSKALFHNTHFCLEAVAQNLSGFGAPGLVLMVMAPFVCARRGVAWALSATVLAIVIAYFFYFTPSAFAGQARYWSEAIAAMILLVAVGLTWVRRYTPRVCRTLGLFPAARTGRAACWLTLTVLLAYGVPKAYLAILDQLDAPLWTRATRMRDLVVRGDIDNAVVFMRSKHYRDSKIDARWDAYGDGFGLNRPDLQGPVIFARDLGPEKNAELLRLYPGRRAYHVDPYAGDDFEILPLDEILAATGGP